MRFANSLPPRRAGAALLALFALFIAFAPPASHAQTKKEGDDYVLSDLEKAVLNEMNLARTSPKEYAAYLEAWRGYYKDKTLRIAGRPGVDTVEGVSALEEAINFMRASSPLPSLQLSTGMCMGAKDQSFDQAKTGDVGHAGSDNSFSWERVARYGEWQKPVSENIAYDDGTAREIVINLIIDDGVPTRGHRRNIFNSLYIVTGVSCGKHPLFGGMCVCTFAGGFTEKSAAGKPAPNAPPATTTTPVSTAPASSGIAKPVPRKM